MNGKDNLSGFELDLSSLLNKEELQRLAKATTEQKKLKAKLGKKPQPKTQDASPIPYRPRWDAVAAVLVLQRTTCSCGATHEAPAARTPLVRFQHKHHSDVIEEQAYHPSLINESLPREVRYLEVSVSACQHCFASKPMLAQNEAQSELLCEPGEATIAAINQGLIFEEACP